MSWLTSSYALRMEGSSRRPDLTTARKLVEDIAKKHGYIRPEVLSRMLDGDRREVEEAMLIKDKLIASTVTTYGTRKDGALKFD